MPDRDDNQAASANRPVLAAVDFSSDSRAAVLWAGEYADRHGAPLLVLHVVHDPAEDPGHYRNADDDWSEPMASIAERRLDDFMEQLRALHPDRAAIQDARQLLASGLPAGRIIEIAERENARLITVGTRGRAGLDHALIGSVAEEVVQRSPVPVTVVKRAEPRP